MKKTITIVMALSIIIFTIIIIGLKEQTIIMEEKIKNIKKDNNKLQLKLDKSEEYNNAVAELEENTKEYKKWKTMLDQIESNLS